jgi:AcrR family transcriptional regulator
VREWIPISTSPRGRLALVAVQEFGARPYDAVTVGELAAAAGVTTGALYHHFGSKLGLYETARGDVERRLSDRMEGAAATAESAAGAVSSALLVGFDYAVGQGFTRLLGDRAPGEGTDAIADLLARVSGEGPALGRVLVAAWRAAVTAVAEGVPSAAARAALASIGPHQEKSLPNL